MKKIFNVFVLVAAAAMTLASCQKNEMTAPEKQEALFTINSGLNSKTVITETTDGNKTVYKPSWDGTEKLGILFSKPASDKDVAIVFENQAEAGALASFQGSASVTENGTFYAFCPADAFKRGYAEGDARLDLKTEQKPTATSFDPSCDILVAKPYDYTVTNGEVVVENLEFARIMSVLRINLKSDFADVQNEFVESVSFTADGVKLAGYARIFMEKPDFTGNWASSGDQYCTVTAKYDSELVSIAGEQNSVYLVVAPVEIPAGKELTFAIKTKNYNITKTVTAPEEMKFTAGKVGVIDLSVKSENCEEIDTSVDYSGEYLIAGKEGEKWYAAKKYSSGNYLAVSEIAFDGENIAETETITDHYMTVQKVSGGDYDGMYTIVDADGKYLSTSSSSSNNMKAVSSTSANTYWTITRDDAKGTYSIVASKSEYEKNDMRFNYNNGTNPRVSCYGSASSQPYLTLFSTLLVKPDTTPRINVEKTEYAADAAATSLQFTYTTKNITGNVTASVKSNPTMKNVSAEANAGTVTVNFDANTEASEKTATIVLSYEGAESVNVVITQDAAGATKQYYVKVTTAPTDWSGTYLLVCESKGKALSGISTTSTKYGIGSDVTVADNKIEAAEDLVSWQVVITKATTTSDAYLMAFNGSYLYWSSGNSLTTDKNDSENSNWKISVSDGNASIVNVKDDSRKIVWNASSPRFACYTSSQTSVQLYRLETSGSGGGDTTDPEPENPGEGGGEAEPVTIIIDGSTLTSTATTADSDHTFGGITFTMSKGAKYQTASGSNKLAGKAILIGKTGAYIYNKAAIPGRITKFEIYANKGASTSVNIGVNFSSSAITSYSASAANTYTKTLSTLDSVYDCSDKLPADARYFWYQVTNDKNSQVQFRITYIPEN